MEETAEYCGSVLRTCDAQLRASEHIQHVVSGWNWLVYEHHMTTMSAWDSRFGGWYSLYYPVLNDVRPILGITQR